MTKTVLATILAGGLLAAGTAPAANLLQGNREIGIGGLVDFDTVDDTLITLDATYGYFLIDFLEAGLRVGITDSSRVFGWRFGGFTEYHLFADSPAVPFVGASVDLLGSDIDLGEASSDENAVAVGADLGVKVFLTESVAVSAQFGVDLATADVYPTEDGADDVNWDLTLGMRLFF